MRKIYLNCGSNKGNDIHLFREKYGDEYEVFAFEPEPRCFDELNKVENITHIKKAIGAEDSVKSFYEGRLTVSGSLREDKFTFMSGNKYDVEVIDFSQWLIDNIKPEDEVICLFNIEGGEYDVFPKLFSTGAYKLITEFYCEMHAKKLNHINEEENKLWGETCIDAWGDKCYIWEHWQSEKFYEISAELNDNQRRK